MAQITTHITKENLRSKFHLDNQPTDIKEVKENESAFAGELNFIELHALYERQYEQFLTDISLKISKCTQRLVELRSILYGNPSSKEALTKMSSNLDCLLVRSVTMERKILQNNWFEMRGQISEWWDDLTDEDLDRINGNPDQLITVLQERYGYTRNLAFEEVKMCMTSYYPEDSERKNRSTRAIKASQYSYYNNDDWSEINNRRGFSKPGTKVHAPGFTDHSHK